jgi:septum formation inhibitor-activating ATPase MinD
MKQRERVAQALKEHLEKGNYPDIGPGAEITLGVTRRVFVEGVNTLLADKKLKTVIVTCKNRRILTVVPVEMTKDKLRLELKKISHAKMID